MAEFITVSVDGSDDIVEIPLEDDKSLLFSSLEAQFPGAFGLRYKNPSTGAWRGVRFENQKFTLPDGNWGSEIYHVLVGKKPVESIDMNDGLPHDSVKKCCDLIVLGLPWSVDEDKLKQYFQQFGDLIKRDTDLKSRGFGFIRFSNHESQTECLSSKHNIDGRTCEVRIPISKSSSYNTKNAKIHVGRLTNNITSDDIFSFFSQHGKVTEVFISKPFRGYAFVSFSDPDVAQSLIGEDLIIKNTSVRISAALAPEQEKSRIPANAFQANLSNYSPTPWGINNHPNSTPSSFDEHQSNGNGSNMPAALSLNPHALLTTHQHFNPSMIANAQAILRNAGMYQQGSSTMRYPDSYPPPSLHLSFQQQSSRSVMSPSSIASSNRQSVDPSRASAAYYQSDW